MGSDFLVLTLQLFIVSYLYYSRHIFSVTLSQPKLQNILKILGNEVTRTSDKDNSRQYNLQRYVTVWTVGVIYAVKKHSAHI